MKMLSEAILNNNDDVSKETKAKFSKTGKFLVGLTGGVAVGLTIICAPFVSPALRKVCLPYVPATNAQIENVMQGLKNRNGKLLDLGSGDGRIVIEAAKHKFDACGVELNPWLVLYSKFDALRNHRYFETKPKFFRRDLWKFDISPYNNVVIFGVEEMMSDLEKKFKNEVNDDSLIIACRFPLPTLEPIKIIGSGIDTVWVYKKQGR